jgi:hypothetical protein
LFIIEEASDEIHKSLSIENYKKKLWSQSRKNYLHCT